MPHLVQQIITEAIATYNTTQNIEALTNILKNWNEPIDKLKELSFKGLTFSNTPTNAQLFIKFFNKALSTQPQLEYLYFDPELSLNYFDSDQIIKLFTLLGAHPNLKVVEISFETFTTNDAGSLLKLLRNTWNVMPVPDFLIDENGYKVNERNRILDLFLKNLSFYGLTSITQSDQDKADLTETLIERKNTYQWDETLTTEFNEKHIQPTFVSGEIFYILGLYGKWIDNHLPVLQHYVHTPELRSLWIEPHEERWEKLQIEWLRATQKVIEYWDQFFQQHSIKREHTSYAFSLLDVCKDMIEIHPHIMKSDEDLRWGFFKPQFFSNTFSPTEWNSAFFNEVHRDMTHIQKKEKFSILYTFPEHQLAFDQFLARAANIQEPSTPFSPEIRQGILLFALMIYLKKSIYKTINFETNKNGKANDYKFWAKDPEIKTISLLNQIPEEIKLDELQCNPTLLKDCYRIADEWTKAITPYPSAPHALRKIDQYKILDKWKITKVDKYKTFIPSETTQANKLARIKKDIEKNAPVERETSRTAQLNEFLTVLFGYMNQSIFDECRIKATVGVTMKNA